MYCINCGKQLEDSYEFCPECGSKIKVTADVIPDAEYQEIKECPECGEEMPADAFYCLNCGNPFDEPFVGFDQLNQRIQSHRYGVWRNKWVALLLCIFFGWLGVHKYYEMKIVMGIIYTLTCGLFCLGWVFDVARLIFKPNPYLAKG